MVPLKYLSNFWKTPEIFVVNYEINLISNWSAEDCVISSAAEEMDFPITDAKICIPSKFMKTFVKLSSNFVGDPNDENYFPRKLLLTNTQIAKLRKVFGNNSSANVKLSATHWHKMGYSGGILGRI